MQTDGQADTIFGILVWKHVGTQKNLTQSSKLGVIAVNRYMHSRMTRMQEIN